MGAETRVRRARADLRMADHGGVSHGGDFDRFGGNIKFGRYGE